MLRNKLHIALSIVFCAAWIQILSGQITVTQSTFPVVGDTLSTIIDNNTPINVGAPGADLTWDMSMLTGAFVRERLFLPPSAGNQSELYPTADMVMQTVNEQDVYLQVADNEITEIGRSGAFIPGIEIPAMYDDRPVFRRAPMQYGDQFEDDSSVSVEVDGALIPEELTMGLSIDSLRVSVVTSNNSTVDAFGTLILPSGSYEVLRERSNLSVNTKIYAKSFLGWTEIPPSLLAGSQFEDFIGEQNSTVYNFYSNDAKEILARVLLDTDGNTVSTEFMGTEISSNLQTISPNQNEIIAFPNPSYGDINIEMINYPLGKYKMEVYNIVGKKLWHQDFDLKSNRVHKVDLTHLRKGTYLYSLFDKNGTKLTTKRIAIVNI